MIKYSRSYFVWLITMAFFAYQFVLRNTPGLMIDELIGKFSISASEFAMFSSSFYLAYALMQIPAGIILDKFNIRYAIPSLVLTFIAGSFIFISTDNFYIAVLGRILMGVGATAGFLGGAKVVSMMFPKSYYSIMISMTFTLGFLGAIYGGKPMSLLLASYGSYNTFIYFIIGGIAISLLGLIFLKSTKETSETAFNLKDIVAHIKNKNILLTAIFGGFMMGSTEGFADAWGIKFISSKFDMSISDASLVVSMVYMGLCFGGPILAWLSEKYSDNYRTTIYSGLIMGALFLVLVADFDLSLYQLIIITLIIGIFTGSQVLIFSITNSFCIERYAGITSAITNSIVMSFGLIIHQMIGFILDMFGVVSRPDGSFCMSSLGFDAAISIIGIFMFIGSLGIYWLYRKNKA